MLPRLTSNCHARANFTAFTVGFRDPSYTITLREPLFADLFQLNKQLSAGNSVQSLMCKLGTLEPWAAKIVFKLLYQSTVNLRI